MGRHSFSFLPSLLSGVELVEAVTDDRDGQADNENPKDGTEASENLAEASNRRHIPISNRGHCYNGPPIGVKHGLEC